MTIKFSYKVINIILSLEYIWSLKWSGLIDDSKNVALSKLVWKPLVNGVGFDGSYTIECK